MAIENIKANKSTNSFHSFVLIFFMAGLLAGIGWLMFGYWGLGVAIALAAFGVLAGPRLAPRLVLKMYKARPILPSQSPELAQMFHLLCRRAELDPLPGLFYVPTKMPNAFAVGHEETAAVALTDGILRAMNPRELEGILAHEVAHLRHRDTYVMGLADTISRLTALFSRIGLMMMFFSLSTIFTGENTMWFLLRGLLLFFAPAIAVLFQLALSRSREFNADMGAVELTNDPYGLASALDKLDRMFKPQAAWKKVLAPGTRQQHPAILRTHPPTEERVKRLLTVAKAMEIERPASPAYAARMAPRVVVSHPRRMRVGFGKPVKEKPRYRIMSGIFR